MDLACLPLSSVTCRYCTRRFHGAKQASLFWTLAPVHLPALSSCCAGTGLGTISTISIVCWANGNNGPPNCSRVSCPPPCSVIFFHTTTLKIGAALCLPCSRRVYK